MALTSENGSDMVMPVAPLYGSGNNGGGFGNFGGDWGWIILLLLLAGGNGWGNGFGGGIGGFAADGAALYPWMNQAEVTTSGFQNQALGSQLNGIQSGVQNLSTQLCNCCGDIQQSLCNGFAGVNATVNSGFANAETAANARQMANMQTAFAGQTAMSQGFNNVQSQLADCCCENRLASADLKYTIATENCADRAAISEGLRDIITNQTANTQRILDQLCQDKIDAKNDEIANLRQQIAMKDLAASQVAQNAFISQGFSNEVDALYNRLSNCPVPTTPVYGRTPIFTCNNNCGCGCGMN